MVAKSFKFSGKEDIHYLNISYEEAYSIENREELQKLLDKDIEKWEKEIK